MNKILESLWIEKFRPKKIKDVVLPEDQMIFFQKCINNNDVPNCLMLGPCGSGKTTTARIIIDNIVKNDMDLLPMNGSDQTGVDTVRDVITPFLKCPPISSKLKIVFIDEFDFLSINAQGALRNIFEKYCETGRFICTANYRSKIIDPLLSRFQVFEMKTISEVFALKFCEDILKAEGIEYNVEDVKLVVSSLVPDLRKIVNTLQKSVTNKKLSGINRAEIINTEKKVTGLICKICESIGSNSQNATINSIMPEIEDIINKEEIDYLSSYSTLFHDTKIPMWAKIAVNKYCNSHQNCAIPSIHYMAMLFEIIENGCRYFNMFGKK